MQYNNVCVMCEYCFIASWRPILDHIESKYEKFLNDESRVNRGVTSDHRVHCCLYFVPPNGHGLVRGGVSEGQGGEGKGVRGTGERVEGEERGERKKFHTCHNFLGYVRSI